MPLYRIVISGHIVETDGANLWVNTNRGQCVARFGQTGYEVCDPDQSPLICVAGRDWDAFRSACVDRLGIEVPSELVSLDGRTCRAPAAYRFSVPLAELSDASPFVVPVWGGGDQILRRSDVVDKIMRGLAEEAPYDPHWEAGGPTDMSYHAGRVAYLVANPADDAIHIDIVGDDGEYRVTDGNHRLAAAFIRRDDAINAEIGGHVSALDLIFPSRIILDDPAGEDRETPAYR